MAAPLLTKALVAEAAELHLLPAAVTCALLAATALFLWVLHSRIFPFGLRPGQPGRLRPTATAGGAPTASASTYILAHYAALCVGVGAVLHMRPLVAVAERHLHPAVVVSVVVAFAALVDCALLSLNFAVVAVRLPNPSRSAFVALAFFIGSKSANSATAPDADRKESFDAAIPPPLEPVQAPHAPTVAAPAARSHQSRLADAAFVVLAAVTSLSWFVEPFSAAAAELRLAWPAVVAILVFFAACFCASIHVFRSFFLPRPTAAAAPRREAISEIAAVAVGVAACLVAVGGLASVHTPARV